VRDENFFKNPRERKKLFSPRLLKTKGGTQKEREKREFFKKRDSRRMRELGRLLGHLLLRVRVGVSIVLLFFSRARCPFFFFFSPFFPRAREEKYSKP